MHKHTASPLPGPALIGIVNAAASWPGMDQTTPIVPGQEHFSASTRRSAADPHELLGLSGLARKFVGGQAQAVGSLR